jgi:hypothetical protein
LPGARSIRQTARWANCGRNWPPGRALEQSDAARSKQVRAALIGWLDDPDLYAVRLPDALAALPQGERAEWQSFWAEVDALLQRAAKSRR